MKCEIYKYEVADRCVLGEGCTSTSFMIRIEKRGRELLCLLPLQLDLLTLQELVPYKGLLTSTVVKPSMFTNNFILYEC